MSAFDLKALKPASSIEGLGQKEQGGALTAKAAALRNITAQIALIDPKADGRRTFWDTVLQGKRSYTGKGDHVGFSVKVGSAKLTLGGTQEPGVAKDQFKATLEGVKAAIEKGELDDQFTKLDEARAARTEKMAATRKAKKAEKPAAK